MVTYELLATNGWFAPMVLASFAKLHMVDALPSFCRTVGFCSGYCPAAYQGRRWRCTRSSSRRTTTPATSEEEAESQQVEQDVDELLELLASAYENHREELRALEAADEAATASIGNKKAEPFVA